MTDNIKGKIIIPGANHENEPEEQPQSVKWYSENERVITKEDRIIVERIERVEFIYSGGRTENKLTKHVLTQHESGRQDVTVMTPRIGTKAKKK